MTYSLGLRETSHVGDGGDLRGWNTVVAYSVTGLPNGQEAQISKRNGGWHLLRIIDGVSTDPVPTLFDSPADALAELQKIISH